MNNDLKKKLCAIAAAASKLERQSMPLPLGDGKVGDKSKAFNALLEAVKELSDDARGLLEELV